LLPLFLEGLTERSRATLLELGCGGGSLAYHFKPYFALTLTDRSAEMLANSQAVNPEAEHIQGDMQSLDLARTFDRVLIHDAIMYATDADQVRAALRTAERHCRPGGRIVVVPDCVRETFTPQTETGGEDGPDGRGLRYLMWIQDPDPSDCTYETTFAYLLRAADGGMRVELDRHLEGVFPRADWIRWFEELGLKVRSRMDQWNRDVFIADKA
jgi:ubiquinone/menaquinone biosynthesis C-methylase UbiE